MRKAVARQPERVECLLNLSSALRLAFELDESLAVCERALALDCGNAAVYANAGNVLCDTGRVGLAIACYERSLRIAPGDLEVLASLSHALLLAGDFVRGWRVFETRFGRRHIYGDWPQLPHGLPKWDGKRAINGHLIVAAEGGLGDALQFVRYGKLLKQAGLRAILVCHKRLVALLQSCAYFEAVIPFGAPPPGTANAWFPLMSLPLLVGTELATIPREVPYLQADPRRVAAWAGVAGSNPALNVGIAWQGRPNMEVGNLRGRSVPVKEFMPLLSIPNVTLFSLQKGPGIEQLQSVDFASRLVVPPNLDSGADGFLDTAALMMHLDLIITSDTSIAHLAGALGRPVWLALNYSCEWRWLLNRRDSPWYPTMKLFRQPTQGRWDAVFSAIACELREMPVNRAHA